MVTFSSATDDFFEYRSDVAFERTDAFPEVNQQTKSFDTKVKTTFKVFRVFFLYNWILINVSELLSRSVSVLANETSVANVEATWHRSNLPQESSSDQLFLYSTEDKTCRPTKQTQYLTVLTSLCPFPSVLCSLASFLSSDNADFGYSKENVQECMFFSLPFSRQAPKSVPYGTNAVVNGLRVKV